MSCQKRSSRRNDVSNPAPKELRDLAGLALRRRQLPAELGIVELPAGNSNAKSS
jgi:hypothetical protein